MSIEQLELASLQVFSNGSLDRVAIYDSNFNPVLTRSKKMGASVDNSAQITRQPLENGETFTDHIIYEPVGISMSLIMQANDYRIEYPQLKQFYDNAEELIITLGTGVYDNMVLETIPSQETTSQYDCVIVNATFIYKKTVTPEFQEVPKQAQNTSTVKTGTVTADTPSDSQEGESSELLKFFE